MEWHQSNMRPADPEMKIASRCHEVDGVGRHRSIGRLHGEFQVEVGSPGVT